MLARIRNLVLFSFAVVFSLLAFPSTTWVVLLCWIAVSWFTHANRAVSVGAILFSCMIILLREPTNSLAITYSFVAVVVSVLVATSKVTARRTRNAAMCCLLISGLAFGAERRFATTSSTAKRSQVSQQSNGGVVCLGDSLTSGLPSIGGFPTHLQEYTNAEVHDFGREGITIAEAKPLISEIKVIRPGVVVVELGGHDFLKKHSRQATKVALQQLIKQCEDVGARVVLCEIPRGFIFDPFFGLEREIAREMDLDLIPDSMIRQLVLFSPFAPPGMWLPKNSRYSDDGLHPNEQGHRMLARTVASYL